MKTNKTLLFTINKKGHSWGNPDLLRMICSPKYTKIDFGYTAKSIYESGGCVGINTNSPSYTLDVSGSVGRIKNAGGSADLILDRGSTSAGATHQYNTAGSLKWYTGLRGLVNNNFYICIMIELANYTIDQLVELQSKVNNLITDYSDGHIYICKIRSYGRNFTNKNIRNTKTLQDLCYEYNGDDGIVDVYTTNKDLGEDFCNYGDTMFIKSIEDYEKWSKYKSLSNVIKMSEQHLIDYEEDQVINPIYYEPS